MKTTAKNGYTTKQHDINKLILCGVFAAVVAVCSWITIPLPFTQVPVNLAILGVLLAGGLLGSKYGSLSLLIYILLGAVGLPVFAGFGAGLGVLVGPTGGFVAGYILCAAIAGIGTGSATGAAPASPVKSGSGKSFGFPAKRIFFMAAGVLACYAFGTIWYVLLMKTSLWVGLVSCVFPFIPLDAIKIAVAAFLVRRLERIIR